MGDVLELKELPKGHVSVTQIEMVRTCPRRYYYRYIKGLKIPPPFVLIKGSAGHETLNTYHQLKLGSGMVMLQDEFVDCFETNLDADINKANDKFGGVDYSKKVKDEVIHEKPQQARDRIVDETVPTMRKYHQLELEVLKPTESESEYTITLSTGLNILLRIDYADGKRIVETKFSSKPMKHDRPTFQQIVYSMAKPGLKARLDRILTTRNKEPFQVSEEMEIKEETKAELRGEYETLATMIKTGLDYRNPGFSGVNCACCGFKDICRRVL